ncbi:hypothetical protein Nepgr_008871 [Nepenthes gracilis]|uniref:Uncharacterized protein n=1 Tax=Nepenthes gracilis TaxID=150966 RepID=A0AAD3S9S8_NEPGR|nr:hypothetical protein Nepgr_008871 [Nepenthes gracilis]
MSVPSVISTTTVALIMAFFVIIAFSPVDLWKSIISNGSNLHAYSMSVVQLRTRVAGTFHVETALDNSLSGFSSRRPANITMLLRKSAKSGSAGELEDGLARARSAIRRAAAWNPNRSLTVLGNDFPTASASFIYRNPRAFYQ